MMTATDTAPAALQAERAAAQARMQHLVANHAAAVAAKETAVAERNDANREIVRLQGERNRAWTALGWLRDGRLQPTVDTPVDLEIQIARLTDALGEAEAERDAANAALAIAETRRDEALRDRDASIRQATAAGEALDTARVDAVRLREALEFYGADRSYMSEMRFLACGCCDEKAWTQKPVLVDDGARAREALEQQGGEHG